MTAAVDDGACPVRWCDEPAGHDGLHVHIVGEVPLHRPNLAYIAAVTVEQEPEVASGDRAGKAPLLALTIGASTTSGRFVKAFLRPHEWEQLTTLLVRGARYYRRG